MDAPAATTSSGLMSRFLAGVLQGVLDRDHGARHQVGDHGLQLLPGHGGLQVLGAGGTLGDEGQAHLHPVQGGQLALGLFRGFLEPLEGHAVLGQVDPGGGAEVVHQPLQDGLVEVLAAQEGVAAGGQHFEHAVVHLHDGEVEGAAAEVVDGQDLPDPLLVQPIGQGRRGGLVDDAQHVEAGDAPGVLGGLALGVVEVGRHRDDGIDHFLVQEGFGRGLQRLEHDGRDLRRGVGAFADPQPGVAVGRLDHGERQPLHGVLHPGRIEALADQAFHREQRAGRVGDRLALGDVADQDIPLAGEGHHAGRGPAALAVGDHPAFAALHDARAAIGGAQVDADQLASH
jgi:hypothetical protein